MANNYMLFSTMAPCASREQADWLEARLQELQEDSDSGPPCSFEREGDNLWLYSDDSFNPELVAQAVCEFQDEFKIEEPWSMEWAETCSRPVVDEFGGGACVCYRGEAHWINTGYWSNQEKDELTGKARRRTLADREIAAILAGLRLLQQGLTVGSVPIPDEIENILTNGGSLVSLSPEDIDELCEQVNCGKLTLALGSANEAEDEETEQDKE